VASIGANPDGCMAPEWSTPLGYFGAEASNVTGVVAMTGPCPLPVCAVSTASAMTHPLVGHDTSDPDEVFQLRIA
jgi:hypothetical protein